VEALVLIGEVGDPDTRSVLRVAGIRVEASVGVARYAARLADALVARGVDYRPATRPLPGLRPHFHLANSSRSFLWRAAPRREPFVVTVHDVVPRTRALVPLYHRMVYPLVRRAAAVVVHSAYAAELLEREAGRMPVRVIPHLAPRGPVLERRAARRALGWVADAPLFLLPGALRRVKLVDETLTAAAPLLERGTLSVAFAGRIADPGLARRARRLGVHVLPTPDTDTYETALAAADAVLVLRRDSVGETNGPLLDALGAGRPVLATRVGSIVEVAGEAARYCASSVEGIRGGLLALCDAGERESRARQAVERGWNLRPDRIAAEHAALFAEVFSD
jgi:glycosyltransferase involved in cell wall biosynthesis